MALRVTPLPGTLEAPAVHLVIQDKNEPASRIVESLSTEYLFSSLHAGLDRCVVFSVMVIWTCSLRSVAANLGRSCALAGRFGPGLLPSLTV
jgi:hypothetical protein